MDHSRPRNLRLATAALVAGCLLVLAVGCEPSLGSGTPVGDAEEPSAAIGLEVGDPERAGLTLRLPTSNKALLLGDEASFYQELDTTIPGLRPHGWMGGQYGFVRNPADTPVGPIFTRVHRGVDIRPLYRDPQGEPLDTVRAIEDGLVVYVNEAAGASSFGRYIVVSHSWDGSSVYSLSAHLGEVWVSPGQEVRRGGPVGRMGYTGAGLARHRAHLHLEVSLMLNSDYDRFHEARQVNPNPHGPFNGLNLRGINPSELYVALRDDPDLTFARFVRELPVAYQVALPGEQPPDLLQRYPWLAADGLSTDRRGGAWLISFTREGVPVEIGRYAERLSQPTVVFVAPEVQRRYLSTGGVLARNEGGFVLTHDGRALMALIATAGGDVPGWFAD